MKDITKFLWTLVGLLFAGVLGYAVSSYAIGDLNKRVLDAAQSLGRVQALTESLEQQNAGLAEKQQDLLERNKRIENEVKRVETQLANVLESDTGKLMAAVQVLSKSPEVTELAARLQGLELEAIRQCQIQLEAMHGDCAPRQNGNRMPAVTSSLTPLKGGWSDWSDWQIASEWDGSPWSCIRARLNCD